MLTGTRKGSACAQESEGKGMGVPAHTMYCENSSINWENTAAAHLHAYAIQSTL